MKSVNINVKSAELLGIGASLRRGLGEALVLRRDGSASLGRLKENPVQQFRPRIPIRHKLLPDEADKMVNDLHTRLKVSNLYHLTAVGLSLGPSPQIDRARAAGLELPPWENISF